ncbi:hypothetical protein F9B85_02120 [Heliorestis acidaminivorans]|uniref:Ribosome-associated protein quality control protein P2 RNA-binding domain-containing protein n=1 Tax=Heliorestis acidaminivorans TaxID=553427 RepID=A0A6I0EXI4_9FIRM|nr:YlmH/Sll1252 family protein [Heliorestis acidaminivorans]KAB2954499.1 hypothetical protein F9B85_02120 [Heliorestis acidaminivorans]
MVSFLIEMTKGRGKFLEHVAEDMREPLGRLIDQAELCQRSGKVQYSNFLEPFLFEKASQLLQGYSALYFYLDGGYEEAERKRFILYPYEYDKADNNLQWLKGELAKGHGKVKHRDYLGSLLGIGIGREKIGDLKITEKGCAVVVDATLAPYIESHWREVNKYGIEVSAISVGEIPPFLEEGKIRSITVSSLRTDAIIAAVWSLSRSKAAELVQKGLLRVNGRETSRIDFVIEDQDLLSLRGYGRARVQEITGTTKKGRISLKIWQPVEL